MKLLARAVPATAAVILTAGLAACTGGAAGSGSGGPPGSGAATPSTSDRSRSANPQCQAQDGQARKSRTAPEHPDRKAKVLNHRSL